MTAARAFRLALGGLGLVTLGYGVYGLFEEHVIKDRAAVGEWLVAGVVGHDFLLAPAVFALCAVAYRLTGARWRGRLAAFLLAGGSLVLISIPALVRQGLNRNQTVLPLDYARNLTVLLLVLAATMVVYGAVDAGRRRRAAADRPDASDESEESDESGEGETDREGEEDDES